MKICSEFISPSYAKVYQEMMVLKFLIKPIGLFLSRSFSLYEI